MVKRLKKPILTSAAVPGYGAIFNAGCINIEDTIYLFARGAKEGYTKKIAAHGYDNYYSDILLFSSKDGENYEFIKVLMEGGPGTMHPYGVEDPRIVKVHNQYIMTYSDLVKPAFSSGNSRIGLALLEFKDNEFFVKESYVVGPPDRDDKDAFVVELKDNKVALIHRIMPNITVAFFDNLDQLLNPPKNYWQNYMEEIDKYILLNKEDEPEEVEKIGAGAPLLRTDIGFLLFYHAKDSQKRYLTKVALLEVDTLKVKKRLKEVLLFPEEDYEKYGDVDNVIFVQGAIYFKEDFIYLTYGAADKVVGACLVDKRKLLAALA